MTGAALRHKVGYRPLGRPENVNMTRLFSFGYGFSAATLAGRLAHQGWDAAGTSRSRMTPSPPLSEAHVFSRSHPLGDPAAAFEGVTALLASVPPDGDGDPVVDAHARDIAALNARGGLAWVGYLSTTGVYGTRDGGWVDENSRLAPTGERGQRRADAEAAWLDLWREHGMPVHVFRLAGIYGPGRNAIQSLRDGKARRIDKPGQVFSRIHVDDIAAVLAASIARPNPGAIYNVCDDSPAPPAEVIEYAADLIGLEPPPLISFEDADLSPMGRSFYADNKRVRNDRIKQELGVILKYPDYKTGLQAILEAEGA